MDIQMPVIDGYEVTRQIKADPTLTPIPIVSVSFWRQAGSRRDPGQKGVSFGVTMT